MKRSTDITCVFATLAEAQPMLELLGAQIRTDTTFPSFRAPACGVSVAIVGMGLTAAAATMEDLLQRARPAAVLNIGIAGALHARLSVGELLRVTAVSEAADHAVPAADYLALETQSLTWLPADLRAARLVSRASPLFDPAIRDRLAATADLVDMEGACIAQRCATADVPCALLKAVSDFADDRATLLRTLEHSARRLAAALAPCLLRRPLLENRHA